MITIRPLLSHTSGFSTLHGNDSRTDATRGSDELERRVNALAEVDPAYEPDERWEYSNTNYVIVGRLIEVVSGQEFQADVSANILEPVGMEDSFVADGEIHESMATAHRPWFATKRPIAENRTDRGTAPQGGIIARQCHVSALWDLGRCRMDPNDQERRSNMLYPTLDAVEAIIAERRRQAEQARRTRRSRHNERSALELTVEDVMADLDPGWLARRMNTDQSAGVAFSEGVLS